MEPDLTQDTEMAEQATEDLLQFLVRSLRTVSDSSNPYQSPTHTQQHTLQTQPSLYPPVLALQLPPPPPPITMPQFYFSGEVLTIAPFNHAKKLIAGDLLVYNPFATGTYCSYKVVQIFNTANNYAFHSGRHMMDDLAKNEVSTLFICTFFTKPPKLIYQFSIHRKTIRRWVSAHAASIVGYQRRNGRTPSPQVTTNSIARLRSGDYVGAAYTSPYFLEAVRKIVFGTLGAVDVMPTQFNPLQNVTIAYIAALVSTT